MISKDKIHQLVDACEDDSSLEAVEAILQQNSKMDWWQILSEQEKNKTLSSLQQAKEGKTITHQQLMEKVWTKFTK